MAIALKRAPEMPKDAPMYTDQVIACGYQRVEASVSDTLKLSEKDTYQADYSTISHENNDQTHVTHKWRAILHVIVARSKDPESLGLFINEIDIQEVKE